MRTSAVRRSAAKCYLFAEATENQTEPTWVEPEPLRFFAPNVKFSDQLVNASLEFTNATGLPPVNWTRPLPQDVAPFLDEDLQGSRSFHAYVMPSSAIARMTGVADIAQDLSMLASQDPLLDFSGFLPLYRDLLALYDGKVRAIPAQGTMMMLYYRRDLIGGGEGGQPPPPRTWAEVAAYARRFNGTDLNGDGKPDYGICMWMNACGGLPNPVVGVLASLVQSKGRTFGLFFEPESMRFVGDTVAWDEALRIVRDLAAFAAPIQTGGVSPNNPCFSHPLFSQGRCAMALAAAGQFKADSSPDNPNSAVRGKVGCTVLPGSERVLDWASNTLVPCNPDICPYAVAHPVLSAADSSTPATATATAAASAADSDPDIDPQRRRHSRRGRSLLSGQRATSTEASAAGSRFLVNHAPYTMNGGQCIYISRRQSMSQQLATYELVVQTVRDGGNWPLVAAPGSEFGPTRWEHLDQVDRWAAYGYHPDDLAEFLAATRESVLSGNVAMDLRAEGNIVMRDSLVATAILVSNLSVPLPEVLAATRQLFAKGLTPAFLARLRQTYKASINYRTAPFLSSDPSASGSGDGGSNRTTLILLVVAVVVGVTALAATVACVLWHVSRRQQFRPLMGRITAPGVGPATTICITDIEGSTRLWESLPEGVMSRAVQLHHECIRRCATAHKGYESAWEGDSFILAFHGPQDALLFCMELQETLLRLPWPEQLLQMDICRPLYILDTGDDDEGPQLPGAGSVSLPRNWLDFMAVRQSMDNPAVAGAGGSGGAGGGGGGGGLAPGVPAGQPYSPESTAGSSRPRSRSFSAAAMVRPGASASSAKERQLYGARDGAVGAVGRASGFEAGAGAMRFALPAPSTALTPMTAAAGPATTRAQVVPAPYMGMPVPGAFRPEGPPGAVQPSSATSAGRIRNPIRAWRTSCGVIAVHDSGRSADGKGAVCQQASIAALGGQDDSSAGGTDNTTAGSDIIDSTLRSPSVLTPAGSTYPAEGGGCPVASGLSLTAGKEASAAAASAVSAVVSSGDGSAPGAAGSQPSHVAGMPTRANTRSTALNVLMASFRKSIRTALSVTASERGDRKPRGGVASAAATDLLARPCTSTVRELYGGGFIFRLYRAPTSASSSLRSSSDSSSSSSSSSSGSPDAGSSSDGEGGTNGAVPMPADHPGAAVVNNNDGDGGAVGGGRGAGRDNEDHPVRTAATSANDSAYSGGRTGGRGSGGGENRTEAQDGNHSSRGSRSSLGSLLARVARLSNAGTDRSSAPASRRSRDAASARTSGHTSEAQQQQQRQQPPWYQLPSSPCSPGAGDAAVEGGAPAPAGTAAGAAGTSKLTPLHGAILRARHLVAPTLRTVRFAVAPSSCSSDRQRPANASSSIPSPTSVPAASSGADVASGPNCSQPGPQSGPGQGLERFPDTTQLCSRSRLSFELMAVRAGSGAYNSFRGPNGVLSAREVPGARLLLRGLRVRLGCHSGVHADGDVSYNRSMARVTYSGTPMTKARAVVSAAHGGMVLLSGATHARLTADAEGAGLPVLTLQTRRGAGTGGVGDVSTSPGARGAAGSAGGGGSSAASASAAVSCDVLFWHAGVHNLDDHLSQPMELFLAATHALAPRWAVLAEPGPSDTARTIARWAAAAPVGQVCLAAVTVSGGAAIAAWNLGVWHEGTAMLWRQAAALCREEGGFLATTRARSGAVPKQSRRRDSSGASAAQPQLMATFPTPAAAARWSANLIIWGLLASWPPALLTHEMADEQVWLANLVASNDTRQGSQAGAADSPSVSAVASTTGLRTNGRGAASLDYTPGSGIQRPGPRSALATLGNMAKMASGGKFGVTSNGGFAASPGGAAPSIAVTLERPAPAGSLSATENAIGQVPPDVESMYYSMGSRPRTTRTGSRWTSLGLLAATASAVSGGGPAGSGDRPRSRIIGRAPSSEAAYTVEATGAVVPAAQAAKGNAAGEASPAAAALPPPPQPVVGEPRPKSSPAISLQPGGTAKAVRLLRGEWPVLGDLGGSPPKAASRGPLQLSDINSNGLSLSTGTGTGPALPLRVPVREMVRLPGADAKLPSLEHPSYGAMTPKEELSGSFLVPYGLDTAGQEAALAGDYSTGPSQRTGQDTVSTSDSIPAAGAAAARGARLSIDADGRNRTVISSVDVDTGIGPMDASAVATVATSAPVPIASPQHPQPTRAPAGEGLRRLSRMSRSYTKRANIADRADATLAAPEKAALKLLKGTPVRPALLQLPVPGSSPGTQAMTASQAVRLLAERHFTSPSTSNSIAVEEPDSGKAVSTLASVEPLPMALLERIIARGLRLRAGVSMGNATVEINCLTGEARYMGPAAALAIALANRAPVSHVVVSSAAMRAANGDQVGAAAHVLPGLHPMAAARVRFDPDN